jgi:hypothetical protein
MYEGVSSHHFLIKWWVRITTQVLLQAVNGIKKVKHASLKLEIHGGHLALGPAREFSARTESGQ